MKFDGQTLAGNTGFKVGKKVLLVVVLLLLALLPMFPNSAYLVSTVTLIMIYMALGQMWNLLGGYAGLLSLGMQAFIGIGGYSLAVFSIDAGLNIFVAVFLGGVISVLFGLVVSPALFKMTGVYFAIGTWVVAEALMIFFSNWSVVDYAKGIMIRSVYFLTGEQIYYIAVLLGVISVLVVYLLMRSKTGLALMAIRDNPAAAESMGVKIFSTKLKCYMIACFFTGITGGVAYINLAYITPSASISTQWTIAMTFMVIIGGIGTMEGPIIGSIIYVALTQYLYNFPGISMTILGAIAVAAIMVVPNGIMGTIHNKTGFELLSPRRIMPPDWKKLLGVERAKEQVEAAGDKASKKE